MPSRLNYFLMLTFNRRSPPVHIYLFYALILVLMRIPSMTISIWKKTFRGTSEEIVGKFRNQLKTIYKNKDRQQIDTSAIYQAYISIGTLMTVCAEQSIDSCPMEGFNPVKFDDVLELQKKNLRSVLLLPVGYRADDDIMSSMKKVRKPLDKVIIEVD